MIYDLGFRVWGDHLGLEALLERFEHWYLRLDLRKVDIRLSGKGNSNSHGARPVHQIISMIKWVRTSRLSIKNSPSAPRPEQAVQ